MRVLIFKHVTLFSDVRAQVAVIDSREYMRLYREGKTYILKDGSKDGLIIEDSVLGLMINYAKESDFKFEYTMLEEKVITDYVVIHYRMQSFVMEEFNRIVSRLVDSGIVNRLVDQYKLFQRNFNDDPHIVLTLEHLGFGFQICAAFLGIAFLCFLAELVLSAFLSRKRPKKTIQEKAVRRRATMREMRNVKPKSFPRRHTI